MRSLCKFYFLVFLFLFSCYAKQESNFNLTEWQGIGLDGKLVTLKDLNYSRIILNVYSPDCIPCIKEIPTLNYLKNYLDSKKNFKIFLVVDPYDITNSELTENFSAILPKAIERIKNEIKEKKIALEVLVMKRPFRVDSDNPNSLVTGRPETLILKTFPLVLYYNFIGAISESINTASIEKEDKVLFFKKILGDIE
jgi:thiol-disulfide isomerase/thioredoxin